MKVKELIGRLEKANPNSEVVAWDYGVQHAVALEDCEVREEVILMFSQQTVKRWKK